VDRLGLLVGCDADGAVMVGRAIQVMVERSRHSGDEEEYGEKV